MEVTGSGRQCFKAHWYKKQPNFGDALTPYLFPKYGLDVEWCPPRKAELVGVGSIAAMQPADTKAIVVGSGFIKADQSLKLPRRQVAAVRGALTAERMGLGGKSIPYGDPGILVAADPATKPSYRVGVVPHYIDKQVEAVQRVKDRLGNDVFVIDVQHNDVEAFLADVAQCEVILSSSLHGLITGWALGRPAGWMELSDRVIGGGFKFHDFFSAFGVDYEPAYLSGAERLQNLEDMCHAPPETLPVVRNNVIDAFAFARRRLNSPVRKLGAIFSGWRQKR